MSRPSDKRERLLEAGRCLIHRQGFRHTTLADIARESGVPLGNVYYYFRTKDELLDAVAHRLGDEFRERAAALESAHAEPRARLLDLLDAVVSNRNALAEHGCPVGSLTQELNKEGCGMRDSVNHALIVRSEWAAEQFRLLGRADAQELGVALIAALQGIILMANAMHDPQVLVRQVARVRDWVAQV
jgi:TetR/AcrR family transcriptional regulator, transcriptional repressor for nem operon